ncbi:MAG: hypothetical protein K9M10_04300 [Candidatus Pacebacteria bacterium]|nr:hypothetical protein [Candidatus Paceibacterota bacterium]MCF7857665.1 hypothetical protein [Candidatus Paceibacterota bacterium]
MNNIIRAIFFLVAVLSNQAAFSQQGGDYTEKYFGYSFDEKALGDGVPKVVCKNEAPDTGSFFTSYEVYCESSDSDKVKATLIWKKYSYSGFEVSRDVLGKWIAVNRPSTRDGQLECKKAADFDGVAGLGTKGSSMYDCIFSSGNQEHHASVVYFNPEHPTKKLSQMLFVWDMSSQGEEAKKRLRVVIDKMVQAIRIAK